MILMGSIRVLSENRGCGGEVFLLKKYGDREIT